jgi:hypothetical protein
MSDWDDCKDWAGQEKQTEGRSKEYLKLPSSHIEIYTTNKTIGQVQQRTSDQCSWYCIG